MDKNDKKLLKSRFWSRRRVVVAIAAAGAIVLLAGLLIWFSAPKDELLTEMPTQQSRLRFLGPLRQPVSAAWQRFRAAWLKPPAIGVAEYIQFTGPKIPGAGFVNPFLSSSNGVSVLLLDSSARRTLLQHPEFGAEHGATGIRDGTWVKLWGEGYDVNCRVTGISNSSRSVAIFVAPPAAAPVKRPSPPGSATPTGSYSNQGFGADVHVPKGSGLLLLGPEVKDASQKRFCILFIPH